MTRAQRIRRNIAREQLDAAAEAPKREGRKATLADVRRIDYWLLRERGHK